MTTTTFSADRRTGVVGRITPLGIARFGAGLVKSTANWPEVAWRLVLASLGLARRDIKTVLRDGTVLSAPPSRAAWWPIFENHYEDVYRLENLTGVELARGDVVLDLGAHIGAAALALSKAWPEATLVCVEPNPAAFTYLKSNLDLNGVQAKLVEAAVGARDGTALLSGAELASCEASTSYSARGPAIEVPVAGIERLFAEAPGPVRVLKLDCEGAEHEVFAEATPELLRSVQLLLLEYHKTPDAKSSWPEVEGRLGELGFETVWHEEFAWVAGLGMAGLRRSSS